jgi:hypothetical protein
MRQASDSTEQIRQTPAPVLVHGLEDKSIFKDSTCGGCSNTEELIQKVVSGTRCSTRA